MDVGVFKTSAFGGVREWFIRSMFDCLALMETDVPYIEGWVHMSAMLQNLTFLIYNVDHS